MFLCVFIMSTHQRQLCKEKDKCIFYNYQCSPSYGSWKCKEGVQIIQETEHTRQTNTRTAHNLDIETT